MDIAENRRAAKYGGGEMMARVLWAAATPLFRWSPRPLFAWRRFLLRAFGARVGAHVNVYPTTRVYLPWNLDVGEWSAIGEDALIYNLGPVTIGRRVTVSHGAHLCAGTHDHRQRDMPLLKPAVTVGDEAWICTEAFVGPGVTVGEGAVVGARAVAVRDVPAWTIVAGNPARSLGPRVVQGPAAAPAPDLRP
jgi:putative colanic acid biosynthesis acetyltransferase WcaF